MTKGGVVEKPTAKPATDLRDRIEAAIGDCEERFGVVDHRDTHYRRWRIRLLADAVIEALDMGKPCAANGCKVRRIAREGFRKYGQDDYQYFSMLENQGLVVTDRSQAKATGYAICNDLANGVGWQSIMRTLMGGGEWDMETAATVFATAVVVYCPEPDRTAPGEVLCDRAWLADTILNVMNGAVDD